MKFKSIINSKFLRYSHCSLMYDSAKKTLQAENGIEPESEQKNAKAALTELFLANAVSLFNESF